MSLLDSLIEEQRRRSLSDRAFARLLGVSQALWSNTRTGKIPVGVKILSGVAREFPLLAKDILAYLASLAVERSPKEEEQVASGQCRGNRVGNVQSVESGESGEKLALEQRQGSP